MLVALCCTLSHCDIDIWASKPMYSKYKGLVTLSNPTVHHSEVVENKNVTVNM